jgi:hypothetical protein
MAIGPISNHLTADHRRLEALLDAAQRSAPIDLGRYAEFRDGLLRHIAIEEKGAAARRPGSAQRHALPIARRRLAARSPFRTFRSSRGGTGCSRAACRITW